MPFYFDAESNTSAIGHASPPTYIAEPVFWDIFNQPQLLHPRVGLRIKLIHQRPEFCIMKFDDTLDIKITIQGARMS